MAGAVFVEMYCVKGEGKHPLVRLIKVRETPKLFIEIDGTKYRKADNLPHDCVASLTIVTKQDKRLRYKSNPSTSSVIYYLYPVDSEYIKSLLD